MCLYSLPASTAALLDHTLRSKSQRAQPKRNQFRLKRPGWRAVAVMAVFQHCVWLQTSLMQGCTCVPVWWHHLSDHECSNVTLVFTSESRLCALPLRWTREFGTCCAANCYLCYEHSFLLCVGFFVFWLVSHIFLYEKGSIKLYPWSSVLVKRALSSRTAWTQVIK